MSKRRRRQAPPCRTPTGKVSAQHCWEEQNSSAGSAQELLCLRALSQDHLEDESGWLDAAAVHLERRDGSKFCVFPDRPWAFAKALLRMRRSGSVRLSLVSIRRSYSSFTRWCSSCSSGHACNCFALYSNFPSGGISCSESFVGFQQPFQSSISSKSSILKGSWARHLIRAGQKQFSERRQLISCCPTGRAPYGRLRRAVSQESW